MAVYAWIRETGFENVAIQLIDTVKATDAHNAELWWIKKYPQSQLLNSGSREHGNAKYLHERWHVNRGVTNSKCRFCKPRKRLRRTTP